MINEVRHTSKGMDRFVLDNFDKRSKESERALPLRSGVKLTDV